MFKKILSLILIAILVIGSVGLYAKSNDINWSNPIPNNVKVGWDVMPTANGIINFDGETTVGGQIRIIDNYKAFHNVVTKLIQQNKLTNIEVHKLQVKDGQDVLSPAIVTQADNTLTDKDVGYIIIGKHLGEVKEEGNEHITWTNDNGKLYDLHYNFRVVKSEVKADPLFNENDKINPYNQELEFNVVNINDDINVNDKRLVVTIKDENSEIVAQPICKVLNNKTATVNLGVLASNKAYTLEPGFTTKEGDINTNNPDMPQFINSFNVDTKHQAKLIPSFNQYLVLNFDDKRGSQPLTYSLVDENNTPLVNKTISFTGQNIVTNTDGKVSKSVSIPSFEDIVSSNAAFNGDSEYQYNNTYNDFNLHVLRVAGPGKTIVVYPCSWGSVFKPNQRGVNGFDFSGSKFWILAFVAETHVRFYNCDHSLISDETKSLTSGSGEYTFNVPADARMMDIEVGGKNSKRHATKTNLPACKAGIKYGGTITGKNVRVITETWDSGFVNINDFGK